MQYLRFHLSIGMVFLGAYFHSIALADNAAVPAQSAAPESSVSNPCPPGEELVTSPEVSGENSENSANPAQKKYYCQAAKTNELASGKNKMVATLYGLAGGMCVLECAGKMLGVAKKMCPITTITAGVVDAAASKQVAGLLSSMIQVPSLIQSFKSGSATLSQSTKMMACVQAAMNFVTMAMKLKSAKKSEEDKETLLAEAAKFPDQGATPVKTSRIPPGKDLGGSESEVEGSSPPENSTGSGPTQNQQVNIPGSHAPVDGARPISDPSRVVSALPYPNASGDCYSVQCIRAENPELPEDLTSADFRQAAEEISGKPFEKLMKDLSGKKPHEVFGSEGIGGAGGLLSKNSDASLLSDEMKRFLASNPQDLIDPQGTGGSIYANSSGGVGAGNGSQSDSDLQNAMHGLDAFIKGIAGASDGGKVTAAGNRGISQAGETDHLETEFNNRKGNLFQRVSRRITKLSISK